MSGRPTADIGADLRHIATIHEGRTRHECIIEAAERLAELDAMKTDIIAVALHVRSHCDRPYEEADRLLEYLGVAQ